MSILAIERKCRTQENCNERLASQIQDCLYQRESIEVPLVTRVELLTPIHQ
jgi:hypothetical protein